MSHLDPVTSGLDSGLQYAIPRACCLCLGYQAKRIPKPSGSCDVHMEYEGTMWTEGREVGATHLPMSASQLHYTSSRDLAHMRSFPVPMLGGRGSALSVGRPTEDRREL